MWVTFGNFACHFLFCIFNWLKNNNFLISCLSCKVQVNNDNWSLLKINSKQLTNLEVPQLNQVTWGKLKEQAGN